jgi:glycosyltransferase involved in cell wall biosynthesis
MNKTTFTIGMPTYEAGNSLVRTLQTLYHASDFDKIQKVIVAVDGKKMSDEIYQLIKNPKLKILQFSKREGQSARINSIIENCKSDYLILLNDDVIIEKNALKIAMQTCLKHKPDLLSTTVLPLPQVTLVEKVITVGVEMNQHVSRKWNYYSNFLSCNGRMLILSKRYYQQLKIPTRLWNNDSYIYFLCKQLKFGYLHNPNIIVRYRSPQTLKDHYRQSKKFGFSELENEKYFKNIHHEYTISTKLKLETFFNAFHKKPLLTILYSILFIKSQFGKPKLPRKGYWETDLSTKNL